MGREGGDVGGDVGGEMTPIDPVDEAGDPPLFINVARARWARVLGSACVLLSGLFIGGEAFLCSSILFAAKFGRNGAWMLEPSID